MPPLLRHLVVAVAVFFAAGVPSYVVAATRSDCCADGCDESPAAHAAAEQPADGEEPPDGCPVDEHDGRCPPFCDGCACAPHAVTPVAGVAIATPVVVVSRGVFAAPADPMSDPLLEGVFHPPRAAA